MSAHGALRRASPWAPGESLRTAVLGAAGVVAVGGGWLATARAPSLRAQIPWVSLSTLGFIVGSFGAVSWLLRARAAIVKRREALLPVPMRAPAPVVAVRSRGDVVVGPAPARFHRPGCDLEVGRGWPRTTRASAVADGREPCGVCAP